MSGDQDLIKLYSQRILALAADMPRTARLTAPDATARRRSPLCGSTVTVDLVLRDGMIDDYGQEVKACALGQAAAAIVGGAIVGLDETAVRHARDQLLSMLKDNGPTPDAPFEELKVLAPARDYRNRHASIMLALEATLDAFAAAKAAKTA
jgi:NifU-like protein involved in Fe-S cluster formation